MKKIFLFSLVLGFFCVSGVFAKTTTDIELGFIYGHGYMNKDQESNGITIKNITTDACGFLIGCDVEITEHFGLFMDLGFLYPGSTKIEYKYNGSTKSVEDKKILNVKFEMDSIIGAEYVKYHGDKFKTRIGIGYAIAGLVSTMSDDCVVESDMLYGLGTKLDGTVQMNKVLGFNFGFDMFFLFSGSYSTSVKSGSTTVSKNGTISDFSFLIQPNLSLTWHIGGNH